jgi:HEAT repeat protein
LAFDTFFDAITQFYSTVSSDSFQAYTVPIAFALGCFTLLLTVALFGTVFILRKSMLRKKKHQQNFIESWAPIWGQCFQYELPNYIPQLTQEDMVTFLTQWIQYQEISDESLRELLCMVALKAGVEKHLTHILQHRSIREKILAITALGFLKDPTYMETFKHWINSSNISVSLASARAMLRLNPQETMTLLVSLLKVREDWPQARMTLFLTEAGIDVISEPLAKAVLETPTPKLINYLAVTNSFIAVPTLISILKTSINRSVILACLQTLSKFNLQNDIPFIRNYLKHPNWECRAAAAKIIGKMGYAADEESLLALLLDSQNIVQYEAALALFEMPHFNRSYAQKLSSQLTEQTGLHVLTRVMTEKRWTL